MQGAGGDAGEKIAGAKGESPARGCCISLMKCTLISLGLSTDAIGLRMLSAVLKQKGFRTQLVFLPTLDDLKRRSRGGHVSYSDRVLDQIAGLAADSGLIGLSVMTHHYATARSLTSGLKHRLDVPVIWGGIHASAAPKGCLDVADLVCVGEGETSIPELLRRLEHGESFRDIPGIWLRDGETVVENGVGPMVEDLDALPMLDYSFDDHHLLIDQEIHPMNAENWRRHMLRYFPPLNPTGKPAYQVLSARGCPYRCTFCGEYPLFGSGFYGSGYFRKRSIDNLMQELEWARKQFPFIGEVCFCDDTFPSRPLSEIEEFSRRYKQKIGLPFYVLVSPGNVTREKFDLLVDAGLRHLGMGIQSGSDRVLKMYNRDKANGREAIFRAASIINSYKNVLPYYDIIVENPYEGREDTLETIRLLIDLPSPMRTRVYALSFFPGTPLYSKAVADGMSVGEAYDKTFGQRSQGGYVNFLIDVTKHGLPKPLLRLLVSKPFLFLFNRPSIDRVFLSLQSVIKGILFKLHVTDSGLS